MRFLKNPTPAEKAFDMALGFPILLGIAYIAFGPRFPSDGPWPEDNGLRHGVFVVVASFLWCVEVYFFVRSWRDPLRILSIATALLIILFGCGILAGYITWHDIGTIGGQERILVQ